ncbi:MAG: hypothetical protein ABFC62_09330 [Clostridiaceae bacterium]|nr:hypothetical protein [Eubacteriales bacterium]
MGKALELENKWFPLDNAAKLYPAITSPKHSCVFRISVNMAEPVDRGVLQRAVYDLKPRFPTMYVRLRHGMFWNYYEYNERMPRVRAESPYMNAHIDTHANNGYHFTVFHYGCRITLETFHSLCDGTGALEFIKAITYRYLELMGRKLSPDGLVRTVYEQPVHAEMEDSFLRCFTGSPTDRGEVKPAYRLRGTHISSMGGFGTINGKIDAGAALAAAKKHGASLTQYLTAALAYAVYESDPLIRRSKRPINVCVPVNMRRYYGSGTLRNFSLFFHTSIPCKHLTLTFEDILSLVKGQFAFELKKEKLQGYLNANVAAEKNLALRLCPLPLKLIALRLTNYMYGSLLSTVTLSNLGDVRLPESMREYVKDIDFNLSVGNQLTHGVGVASCNGRLTISILRSLYETDFERCFFSFLASEGLDVEIQSNLREAYDF